MTMPSQSETPPPIDIMEPIFSLANCHRKFTEKMILSLEHHTLNGKSGWDGDDRSLSDIKVAIVRNVMEGDFVSAANHAMFADHHTHENQEALIKQTRAIHAGPAPASPF